MLRISTNYTVQTKQKHTREADSSFDVVVQLWHPKFPIPIVLAEGVGKGLFAILADMWRVVSISHVTRYLDQRMFEET